MQRKTFCFGYFKKIIIFSFTIIYQENAYFIWKIMDKEIIIKTKALSNKKEGVLHEKNS